MTAEQADKRYTLYFEDRQGYLFARVDGKEDSYEISRQFWTEIAEECAKREPERLFVQENIELQVQTIAEIHQGSTERPHMGLMGLKIAFYDSVPNHHEQNQFGELVVRNRGLELKVFDDEKEALAWLLRD